MPFEEISATSAHTPPLFQLGQEVLDKEGKRLGKIQARFSHYILVERGSIFLKTYYVPHGAITTMPTSARDFIRLSLSEDDLRKMELTRMPEDLYVESPELGVPDVSGVAQFARGPLSPAETGHYNYGRRSPGMNTDASGSYHRDEVLPKPQNFVGEKIFSTDLPIEPRDISSN